MLHCFSHLLCLCSYHLLCLLHVPLPLWSSFMLPLSFHCSFASPSNPFFHLSFLPSFLSSNLVSYAPFLFQTLSSLSVLYHVFHPYFHPCFHPSILSSFHSTLPPHLPLHSILPKFLSPFLILFLLLGMHLLIHFFFFPILRYIAPLYKSYS